MNFKTTLVLLLILAAVGVYLKFFALKHNPVKTVEGEVTFLVPEAHYMNATHFALKRETNTEKDVFASVVVGKARGGWRLLNPFRFVLKEKVVEDYLITGLRNIEVVERFKKDGEAYPGMKEAELEKPSAVLTFRLLTKDEKHERQMQLHLGRALTAGRYYARLIAGTKEDEDVYVIRGTLPDQLLDLDVASWPQNQLGSPVMSAVKGLRVEMRSDDNDSGSGSGSGMATIIARRDGTGMWRLTDKASAQQAGRGSETAIADYLTKLGALSTLDFQVVDRPEKLSDFGLDKPMMKVAIAASAGSARVLEDAYQLNIGDRDLSGKAYYANWVIGAPNAPTAAVDDKAGGMLNQTIYPQSQVVMRLSVKAVEALKLKADVLRDRRVIAMRESDLKNIRIARKGIGRDFNYGITRDGSQWRFDETNPTFEIDPREISSLVGQLLGLTAESFNHDRINEIQTQAIDQRPRVEITIGNYLGKKSMLRLTPLFELSSGINVHARKWLVESPLDPTHYVIGESQLQRLLLPPLALKQRKAMELPLDKVFRIVLKREDSVIFDFEKQSGAKGGWGLNGYKLYAPKLMENLLRQIQSLRVAQWLATESVEDSQDAITSELSLHTTAGVIGIKLNVFNGQGQINWLKKAEKSEGGIVLNVGAFKATPQLMGLLRDEYRLRSILGAGSDKVQQIALALGQDTVHIQRSQRGVFSSPQLKGMDQKAAARLFDLTAGLSAIRYLDLDPAFSAKLLDDAVQTQLRIQLVDGRAVTVDVVGKASSLMAKHPELKPLAGIKSWVLARVIGRIPVAVSKIQSDKTQREEVPVTWCLLPDKALDQLLGMSQ